MLEQLIYVSLPAEKLSEADVEKIIEAAQVKNLERRITGFLLFDGRMFLQLIEGPPEEVEWLYANLLADPRHLNVQKIWSGTTETRLFSNWSMAYAHLGGSFSLDFGGTLTRTAARQLAATLKSNPTNIRTLIADSLLDLAGETRDIEHSVFTRHTA